MSEVRGRMSGVGGRRSAQARTVCLSCRHIAIGVMSVTFMISCALSAGAFDVTITADEVVGTNTTYDNQSILIDGASVTLDGFHAFSTLHLTNGARLTHSYTGTDAEYSLALTVSGLLSICSNSMIDVTGRGYRGGYTYGNTTDSVAAGGAGGSYGGLGGWDSGRVDSVPNSVYGDFRAPNELGSGGAYPSAGGAGGGLVKLYYTFIPRVCTGGWKYPRQQAGVINEPRLLRSGKRQAHRWLRADV